MSTSSTTSTSVLQPQTMTGVSSMSSSLQSILTRAVQIAQLPITSLQNKDADVLSKETLLSGVSSAASTLGDAVTALGKLAAGSSLGATSSDSTIVSVQNSGAAAAATYTVSDIKSIATAASATSTSFSNASGTKVSANGSMELKFGTKTYDFTLTDKTITGLKDKINGLGAGVTATVLTTSDKNYLSITASDTGAVTNFSLVDDPGDSTHANTQLLSTPNLGLNADFKLNGVEVTQASNTVNSVVSGMTFTLLKVPTDTTTDVTLTLKTDSSQLSSAISTFVSAYNSMYSTVSAQVGASAGLLSGDFVISEAQQNMRALTSYSGSGTIKSLSEMGITFDDTTGKMSFNSDTFDALTDSQIQGAIAYFGSTTTGFGALAKKFTQMSDSVSGDIQLEINGLKTTDTSLQSQISTLQDRANVMQTALASRLEAADTLIAGLESQKTILSSSITSLNYVLYGTSTSSSSS